jgi:hypothetical protein
MTTKPALKKKILREYCPQKRKKDIYKHESSGKDISQ